MSQQSLRLRVVALAVTLSLAAGARGQDEPEKQAKSRNNLKTIGVACYNYHDVFGRFPTSTRDKDGKPLLSWRVEILPYIEGVDLYNQFRLDEPWDSEHNRRLIAKMPKVFQAPGVEQPDKTVYLQPVGPDAMFPRDKSDPRKRQEVPRQTINGEHRALSLRVAVTDIVDGTSNTVMLVEADPKRAMTWTKPDDFEFDVEKPKAGLGGVFAGGFHALLADGSVHLIPLTTDEKVLRDLFNPADGHALPEGFLK